MRKTTALVVVAGLVAWLAASPSQAAFNLQITEIWHGQDGPDLTDDWFELTNYGPDPWTVAGDGNLFADDNSASFGSAVLVQGLTSIASGQSAVVLMEDDGTGAAAFAGLWAPKNMTGVPIGWADGSGLGLGSGGDAVNVWLVNAANLLDSESFVNGPSGVSWDDALGAYSTPGNASGAVATTATAGTSGLEPAIGSPGTVVPEPSTFAMAGLGALGLGLLIRRRRAK